MNDFVFELTDNNGRKIHLSKERWKHIRTEHPEITNYGDIEKTIVSPVKILLSDRDEKVNWFFLYNKPRKRYLKVSIKYLNGEGYVITAHYTKKLQ